MVVTLREGYEHRGRHSEMSFGGPDGMSADEIAEQRARRLLTGEPKARKNDMHGPEMMIRGMGDVQVTESALPRLLASVDRSDRLAWELVRLELVRLLLLTNCVERIDRPALRIAGGKLVEIDFRGTPEAGHDVVTVQVNLDHPFSVGQINDNEVSLSPVLRLVAALALAEKIARDSGVKSAGLIRANTNQILSAIAAEPAS